MDFLPIKLAESQAVPYNGRMIKLRLYPQMGCLRSPLRGLPGLMLSATLFLSGCQAATPVGTLTLTVLEPAASQTQPATKTPTVSAVPSQTPSPAPTSTATQTPTDTITPSPTLTPTYAILRAKVLVRSNCRYGPGWPYLYKYGLVAGSNFEVLGRTEAGDWLLVQGVGDHDNACWVKGDQMDVKGEVMTVQPTYIPLPQSPYYVPPTGVTASRDGDNVTVSWNAVSYRAGDETASPPYLLEAWVCQGGKLVFTPVGTYETMVTVIDEVGCSEPSHGRVFFVEKHGYTNWVEVPWPLPEGY